MIYLLVSCMMFTDERAAYSHCSPVAQEYVFQSEDQCRGLIQKLDLHRVWKSKTLYIDYRCAKGPGWSLTEGDQ